MEVEKWVSEGSGQERRGEGGGLERVMQCRHLSVYRDINVMIL